MAKHNFKKGDEVRYVGTLHTHCIGHSGVVIVESYGGSVGVDFGPGFKFGHDLDGALDRHNGYYVPHAELEKVENDGKFYLIAIRDGVVVPMDNFKTFPDGVTAGKRAKELTDTLGYKVQPRPIASDADSSAWRDREHRALGDGTYKVFPKTWDLAPIADHFAHIDPTNNAFIRYTASPVHGVIGRKTRTTVGRYLEQFYPQIKNGTARNAYIAMIDKSDILQFAESPEEAVRIYQTGPNSCMAGGKFTDARHPARVYHGGDVRLAYIKNKEGRISGRAVCWPDRKLYGRIYGDTARMGELFRGLGFKNGHLVGARLPKIWDASHKRYFMPFLDDHNCLRDENPDAHEGFFTITTNSDGTWNAQSNTSGYVTVLRICPKSGQRSDSFVMIHGLNIEWSTAAAERYAKRLQNPETKQTEWWPNEAITTLEDGSHLPTTMVDKYTFLDAITGQRSITTNKVDLPDGRMISQNTFAYYGYVCAGSGRRLLKTDGAIFINSPTNVWDHEFYSPDFVNTLCQERGLTLPQAIKGLSDKSLRLDPAPSQTAQAA